MSDPNRSQTEYDDYLARRHAEMVTPAKMIADLVNKATGKDVEVQERLMRGEQNEVYDVKLKDGEEVIVRIAHEEFEAFEKEEWAINRCQEVGVPVPRILLVENNTTGNKFRSFCVMEKLSGDSLGRQVKNGNISETERDAILREVGRLFSKVHSIKTQKFGWINEKGVGQHETWEEDVLKKTDPEKINRVKEAAKQNNFDSSLIAQAVEILQNHKAVFADVEPRLLHGDLGFDHIFVDDKKITGIIDWGNAASGDPMHDFAWFNFYNGDEFTTLLMEGYKKTTILKDFGLKLNLYKLYLGLDQLDYYHDGGFKEGVEFSCKQLIKALNYLDKNE